jgi:hypothetical protein
MEMVIGFPWPTKGVNFRSDTALCLAASAEAETGEVSVLASLGLTSK